MEKGQISVLFNRRENGSFCIALLMPVELAVSYNYTFIGELERLPIGWKEDGAHIRQCGAAEFKKEKHAQIFVCLFE